MSVYVILYTYISRGVGRSLNERGGIYLHHWTSRLARKVTVLPTSLLSSRKGTM